MLERKCFVCRMTVLALFMVGIAPVRGQEPKHPDLTASGNCEHKTIRVKRASRRLT